MTARCSACNTANFHQHRVRNPGMRLRYLLLSNAKIVQERGHVHTSGLKGIELWTSATAITDPTEQKTRLDFLRGVLLAPSEPPKIDRKQLQNFRTFVRTSSDDIFLDFVRSFTWMKVSSDIESAFASAEQAISVRKELQGFEQAAPLCLQALLQHVLLVLSQPGTKQLLPETCTELLQSSQQQATEAVAQGLASAREQIVEGAAALANNSQQLGDIVNKLSVQAATAELVFSGISIYPGAPAQILPILEAPNLVSPSAPRTDLRQRVAVELASRGAAALIGDVACGKSQLALLSAEGIERVTWLSLRANEGIDPSALLDAAALRCLQPTSESGDTVSRALIIDDLEIGIESRKFCDRLALIARELRSRGVFLLACSTGRLPSSLQDRMPRIPSVDSTPGRKHRARWLTSEEQKRLIRAVRSGGEVRDLAVVTLMLNTGIRTSELCDLRWEDLDIEQDRGIMSVYRRKTNSHARFELSSGCRKVLLALGYEKNKILKERIFLGRGRHITRRSIEMLIKNYARTAGIQDVTPMTLRHTFIARKVEGGEDPFELSQLVNDEALELRHFYLPPSVHEGND